MEGFFSFFNCDQLTTPATPSNVEEFCKYITTIPAATVTYQIPEQNIFQEEIQDLPFLHLPSDVSGSLPGSVEFTAKGTKILQHCFVSSLQPAAQMDQLKGNKRQPLVGQMVLRGGLGADW